MQLSSSCLSTYQMSAARAVTTWMTAKVIVAGLSMFQFTSPSSYISYLKSHINPYPQFSDVTAWLITHVLHKQSWGSTWRLILLLYTSVLVIQMAYSIPPWTMPPPVCSPASAQYAPEAPSDSLVRRSDVSWEIGTTVWHAFDCLMMLSPCRRSMLQSHSWATISARSPDTLH